MMVEAIAYLGEMNDGVSKPKKFLCDDGTVRVVKFNHPNTWNRSLLHEYVGYRLAKYMNLPVLDQCFVTIPTEMARIYNDVEGFSAGIKIGSPLKMLDNNIDRNGLFRDPLVRLYSTCCNNFVIPGILTFDIWVHNNDRGSNHGNLLVIPEADGRKMMYIHDHGYSFFGPESSMQRYKNLTEFRGAHLTWQDHLFPWGPVYEALKFNIDLSENNPFVPFINSIESISRDEINTIMKDIPDEWQIPEYEINAIQGFLFDRKYIIKDCLNFLVDRFWFPVWKGGKLDWQDLLVSSQ